jgi:hypothetical protein
MNNIQFLNFTLKALLAALINLSSHYPAQVIATVPPAQIAGLQSDVQMVYSRNMLGDSATLPAWEVIKPIDQNGIVIPTTTTPVVNVPKTFVSPPATTKTVIEPTEWSIGK